MKKLCWVGDGQDFCSSHFWSRFRFKPLIFVFKLPLVFRDARSLHTHIPCQRTFFGVFLEVGMPDDLFALISRETLVFFCILRYNFSISFCDWCVRYPRTTCSRLCFHGIETKFYLFISSFRVDQAFAAGQHQFTF